VLLQNRHCLPIHNKDATRFAKARMHTSVDRQTCGELGSCHHYARPQYKTKIGDQWKAAGHRMCNMASVIALIVAFGPFSIPTFYSGAAFSSCIFSVPKLCMSRLRG